jgi:hypothetical protein
MKRTSLFFVPFVVLSWISVASAQGQFPMADMAAQNLITHYQNSTCEQLWQEKMQKQNKPKTPREQEAIQILQANQAMRAEFINLIAAPVLNKMFECGMIP